MSSSYEFWIPSNQNTSSSHYTTIGPGGVEYYGSPENLSNSNELVFGNAIKTQMGNTVNSYLGGYTANYTPYYIATILGGYQQTIAGMKSEAVFGVKWEYKLAGKYEWVFGDAGENKNVFSMSTRAWGVKNEVKASSTETNEGALDSTVVGPAQLTNAAPINQDVTDVSIEGASETKDFDESETDVASSQKVYGELIMAADTVTLSCPDITFSSAIIILN